MNAMADAPAPRVTVSVSFLMTMMLVSLFASSLYVPSLPRIAD